MKDLRKRISERERERERVRERERAKTTEFQRGQEITYLEKECFFLGPRKRKQTFIFSVFLIHCPSRHGEKRPCCGKQGVVNQLMTDIK